MERKPYPTDMRDNQWQIIAPIIPAAKPGGHPRTVDIGEVLNGSFYVLGSSGHWRMLPHDVPCWQTVYDYYGRWQRARWEQINQTLPEQVPVAAGREHSPSAGIIASQSTKTTEQGGQRR